MCNHFGRKITAQKNWFSIKDFFSKCDQIRRKLRIWSHLLKKSLTENLIFCAVDFDLNALLGRYLKAPIGLLFIEHFKHNWEGTAQNIKTLSIINSSPYPFIKVSFVKDIFSCLLTLFFEKWFWKNNSNNNCWAKDWNYCDCLIIHCLMFFHHPLLN